jgi:hypothetical protein
VPATAFVRPARLAKFDRLAGTYVASRREPRDREIDPASGRIAAGLNRFPAFVKDAIWDWLDHATCDAIRAQLAIGTAR